MQLTSLFARTHTCEYAREHLCKRTSMRAPVGPHMGVLCLHAGCSIHPILTKVKSAASLLGGTSMFARGVSESAGGGEGSLLAGGAIGGAGFFHLPALLDVAAGI